MIKPHLCLCLLLSFCTLFLFHLLALPYELIVKVDRATYRCRYRWKLWSYCGEKRSLVAIRNVYNTHKYRFFSSGDWKAIIYVWDPSYTSPLLFCLLHVHLLIKCNESEIRITKFNALKSLRYPYILVSLIVSLFIYLIPMLLWF